MEFEDDVNQDMVWHLLNTILLEGNVQIKTLLWNDRESKPVKVSAQECENFPPKLIDYQLKRSSVSVYNVQWIQMLCLL